MPCRIFCLKSSTKLEAFVTHRTEEMSEGIYLAVGAPSPPVFDEFKKRCESYNGTRAFITSTETRSLYVPYAWRNVGKLLF